MERGNDEICEPRFQNGTGRDERATVDSRASRMGYGKGYAVSGSFDCDRHKSVPVFAQDDAR